MTGLYAYAAVAAAPSRLGRGAGREKLRAVELGSVCVLVGVRRQAPSPTEASLRAHDAVVRAAARGCDAVVPFRFASWFVDEAALRRDVGPMAAELRETLALVRGCDQMTVRLFDPRRPRARPRGRSPGRGPGAGARYLAARAAAEHEPEALVALRRALDSLVRAERSERHEALPLVATVYHLVERPRARAYADAVRDLLSSLEPVRLTVSGPWPAYAFARTT